MTYPAPNDPRFFGGGDIEESLSTMYSLLTLPPIRIFPYGGFPNLL